jgi:type II secretion system protein H
MTSTPASGVEATATAARVKAGFTLLELIIVMVIVATLLAAAAPSLRGFYSGRRTANVASQLVAITQFAQQAAVNEGRVYRLNLDPDERTWWLTMQEGSEFVEPLHHTIADIYELPDDIDAIWVDAQGHALQQEFTTFYPTGKMQPATIRVIGRMEELIDVTCGSMTESFRAVAPLLAPGEPRAAPF